MDAIGQIGHFILVPLYYAVSAVLLAWHQLFSLVLPERGGMSWVLSIIGLTLVIRAAHPIRPYSDDSYYANGFMHLRLVVHNGGGQGWIEFEFELQEKLGVPSDFGDGLSFNQRKMNDEGLECDRFADYHRDYEPYDRVLFRDGHVDPRSFVTFGFFITDFTPDPIFYLRQDPRIPFS